jgi:CNT family concentrative nucleoside transporter
MTATPTSWRAGLFAVVAVLALGAWLGSEAIPGQVRSGMGFVAFLTLVAACSRNLRALNWRTIGWGIAIQVGLALFVLRTEPGYRLFNAIAEVVKKFLDFTDHGSMFVFGELANPQKMEEVLGKNRGFLFAFKALPTIIFVSSFFTVLYYFGVLQLIVRGMARVMRYFMQTSGSETLSASANVFMGQTEAPLIVKPYIERMTQSELLALMAGGMATISGGLLAVFIGMKADAVALLTTSVMAAPCSLYLAKLLWPETEQSQTHGAATASPDVGHVNVLDAAASGASDGLKLALNVAAMLIAFLAFIAMFDYILGAIDSRLSLARVFSWVFAPAALLLGVDGGDVGMTADLLGTKLVANEFVAYTKYQVYYFEALTPRGRILCTFALTGFANFASIAIQIGGIGALAPSRRQDLARLGTRALLVGFLATMVNACLAGMLLD